MSTVTVTMCHDKLSKKHSDNGSCPAVTAASRGIVRVQTPASPQKINKQDQNAAVDERRFATWSTYMDRFKPHLLPRKALSRAYAANKKITVETRNAYVCGAWLGWWDPAEEMEACFDLPFHRCQRRTGGLSQTSIASLFWNHNHQPRQPLGNLYDWMTKGGADH